MCPSKLPRWGTTLTVNVDLVKRQRYQSCSYNHVRRWLKLLAGREPKKRKAISVIISFATRNSFQSRRASSLRFRRLPFDPKTLGPLSGHKSKIKRCRCASSCRRVLLMYANAIFCFFSISSLETYETFKKVVVLIMKGEIERPVARWNHTWICLDLCAPFGNWTLLSGLACWETTFIRPLTKFHARSAKMYRGPKTSAVMSLNLPTLYLIFWSLIQYKLAAATPHIHTYQYYQ